MDMKTLKDKVIVITGASSGIGEAMAREYAAQGARVVLGARSVQKLQLVAGGIRTHGGQAAYCGVDVTKPEECRELIETAVREFGRIDVLVNNAGISRQCLFQDMDDETWDRFFAVNVNGAKNTIQAVLPHMLSEKAGCIVNLSSIWGLRGASCEVAYAATKAALVGLTRSLALELAPSHIRVNAVAPGCIETDMVRMLGPETRDLLIEETPLGRLGTPEDIAHAVAFLASDKASFLTGQILTADGGFTV